MGLFSSDQETTTEENQEQPQKEDPKVAIVKEEKQKASYTRHTAEIKFSDDTSKTVEFDEMQEKGGVIVLEDYLDYKTEHEIKQGCGQPSETRYVGGFESQKFMTVSLYNVKTFETVERENKEMEYTETVREVKRESEVEEDEVIIREW